jgi:hypothetical protein
MGRWAVEQWRLHTRQESGPRFRRHSLDVPIRNLTSELVLNPTPARFT